MVTKVYLPPKTPNQILKKHLEFQDSETVKNAKQKAAATHIPTSKQQNMDFGGSANPKLISWQELRFAGRYVMEEMLPLDSVDLPSFSSIITQFNSIVYITVNKPLSKNAICQFLPEDDILLKKKKRIPRKITVKYLSDV